MPSGVAAIWIKWRASLVPAAAVIPAPWAYTIIVAVKRLVVGLNTFFSITNLTKVKLRRKHPTHFIIFLNVYFYVYIAIYLYLFFVCGGVLRFYFNCVVQHCEQIRVYQTCRIWLCIECLIMECCNLILIYLLYFIIYIYICYTIRMHMLFYHKKCRWG